MSDTENFSELLAKYDLGKIIMLNFIHSIKYNILDKSTAKNFILEWILSYKEAESKITTYQYSSDRKIELLKRAYYLALDTKFLTATSVDRTSLNSSYSSFYSIKDYEQLYRYSLNNTIPPNGDSIPPPDTENLDEEIEKHLCKDIAISLSGSFSNANTASVYWVCVGDDIDLLLDLEERADVIRDYLGLVHVEKGVPLCIVELDLSYLLDQHGNNQAFRPTPIDAGFHERFKCLSDFGIKNGHGHEEGYTYHLRSESDGGREFVVCESKAKKVEIIKLKFIGRTVSKPNNSKKNTEDFIKKLLTIENTCTKNLIQEFCAIYE